MKKINLIKAREENKSYISLDSFTNTKEDIIYLRFTKEFVKDITNEDIAVIITNKEKMLNKLHIIVI